MKIVYVVFCIIVGKDVERIELSIVAYEDKKLAEKHAKNAKKELGRLYIKYGSYFNIPQGLNKYDVKMRTYSKGMEYCIKELEIGIMNNHDTA